MFQISAIGNNRLTAQTPYWDAPGPGMFDLYFDANRNGFKNNGSWGTDLANLISNTGGTGVLYEGSAGWQEQPVNGGLLLTDYGLTTSIATTNFIRNSGFSGVALGALTNGAGIATNWGSYIFPSNIGSVVRSIVGFGTIRGMPYVDINIAGLPGGSGGTMTIELQPEFSTSLIPVAAGQVWTQSVYMQLLKGSFGPTGNVSLGFSHWAGGSYLSEQTITAFNSLSPNAANLARYVSTATIPDNGTAFIRPQINIYVVNNVAFDFTIRIACPQLERNNYATHPIVTTVAAGVRSGNRYGLDITGKASLGTLGFIQFTPLALEYTAGNSVLNFHSGSSLSYFGIQYSSANQIRLAGNVDGNTQSVATISDTITEIGKPITAVFSFEPDGIWRGRTLGHATNNSNGAQRLYPSTMPMTSISFGSRGYSVGNNTYSLIHKFGVLFGRPDVPINKALFDTVVGIASNEHTYAPVIL